MALGLRGSTEAWLLLVIALPLDGSSLEAHQLLGRLIKFALEMHQPCL
jgi:hypothetical protein